MKNIIKVFKRDLRKTIKNPIALLIVVALCILPSLYAWVNIYACWDPYNNTGTVPVAIVNEDEGVEFLGKHINIGEEVQNSLKENTSIGWDFVTEKKGDIGLVDGSYYAMIVIPKDFSNSITSISSDTPKKPEIIYKVNTKATPVVGKITEVAQEKIVEEITSNFISTVNKSVFEKLNIAGEDLEKNKNELIELRKGIIYVNKHLDEIINSLDNGSMASQALNEYLVQLKASLPEISQATKKLQESSLKKVEIMTESQKILNESCDNMRIILGEVTKESEKIHDEIQSMINSGMNMTDISTNLIQIEDSLNKMEGNIDSIINYLTTLNSTGNSEEVANLITQLTQIKGQLEEEQKLIDQLIKGVLQNSKLDKETLNKLNDLSYQNIKSTNDGLLDYDKNARGAVNSICDNLIQSSKDANDILKNTQGVETQINNLLSLGIEGTSVANSTTEDLSKKLKDFRGIIKLLGDALEKTNENDVIQIISILQSKPELMGEFISSPVNLKEEPVYGIPNYGSAMAPIYSVLALWVGALMLISVLKVNPPRFEGDENITIRQKYCGKLLFFVFLGFLQGFIVSVGNIAILGVHTVSPFLMVVMSCFIGIVFNIIVYTLMSVFGNLGKAFAIILMVIQLAGCGGSYPIQLDPKFFRVLQPFFPFTYAVGGYREAIAGPLPSAVALDFVVLLIYAIVFILIGVFFKKKLHKTIEGFEKNFEESKVSE
ncbi:MAG: YhgE/Pip family protein [Clostridium sp.]